jgi:RNA polymerase sigma-70 factor (ECF subfamily)
MKREDFERLYEEHAQPLFGFLVYRTGDRVEAEDVLGEAFLRALRGRKRFDRRRGSEKAWLYSIALNVLRDQVRRSAAESRALERVEAVAAVEGAGGIDVVEDRDLVARALDKLSPEEREAIALRYGGQLTVPEMARALDLPLRTVESRVHRALRKLREDLR